MKKILLSIFLLFFHYQVSSQADNIELNGIGELRLGAFLSDVEALLEKQDTVPPYAWYARISFEEAMLISEFEHPLSAADSLYINQYIEGRLLNRYEKIYYPKDATLSYFAGLRITSIKLFLDRDFRIISIYLTIDPEDTSEDINYQLIRLLESRFGYAECDTSLLYVGPPYPFYCSWYSEDRLNELLVSDAREYGGGLGRTLNIVFTAY